MKSKKEEDMGIVIINGKKYDSVTGLMLTNQDSEDSTSNNTSQATAASSSSSPQWINNFINERSEHRQTESKTSANTATPDWINKFVDERKRQQDISRMNAQAKAQAAENEVVNRQAYEDQMAKLNQATTDNGNTEASKSNHRLAARATSARRSAGQSRTLNRRFVEKPLNEAGQYNKSMVERQLEAKSARQAAPKSIDSFTIPEADWMGAIKDTNSDFIPVLTKKQSDSLKKSAAHANVDSQERNRVTIFEAAQKREESVALHVQSDDDTRRQAFGSNVSVHKASHPVEKAASIPLDMDEEVKPVSVADRAQQSRLAAEDALADSIAEAFSEDDDEDIMNQRFNELHEIINSASELDKKQSSRRNRSKSRRNRRQQKRSLADSLPKPDEDKPVAAKKRGFRAPAVFATLGAVAAVAAIGVYFMMPSVNIKMAAVKAGVNAKNPYTPDGYSIDGKVAYAKDKVTIHYKDNSGSDGYTVTQQNNKTDKDIDLQRKVSAENNGYYEELRSGSQSLYRYGDKVTWLKDGVQYTIDTNDFLDNQQIGEIAASLN